jgi:hypothetical protein
MNLSNSQRKTILVFVLGTIAVLVLFYFLDSKDKTLVNFFTLFGTFASLFGLWLAYMQILSLKISNDATKIAVNKSLNRINQVLSVSELSKANKIIQEIQSSNINNKHELSLLRMKDLKHILIQIKFNTELNIYTETNTYNTNITDLSIDISNLNDFILGTKKGVNFSKLNSNLEKLSTTLSEFENKLKFETK